MENEEKKDWKEEIYKQVEKQINDIVGQEVQPGNVDYLSKLVDIQKDIKGMEEKEMMYRADGNYGEYGAENYGRRGVPGTGRGRYRENYGRRGVDSKYRGEEMIDEMSYHYGNYSEGKEMYGADNSTMESFQYMLKAFKDYYKHLKTEASSQEEIKLLEQTAREIANM